MKLSASLLLVVAAKYANAAVNDPLQSCVGCLDDLDESRDCLRQCDENGQLGICIDDEDKNVDNLDDFIDCCDFDGDCRSQMQETQECLNTCFDGCLKDDAKGYLECLQKQNGRGDCSIDNCIDKFLEDDTGNDLGFGGGISLGKVQSSISGLDGNKLGDCKSVEPFVKDTCDIGRECCDNCERDLGAFVGCLVNSIVIPFAALTSNTTIDPCPIDEQNCLISLLRERELEEQEQRIQSALDIISKAKRTTKRDPENEARIHEILNRRKLHGEEQFNITEAIEVCLGQYSMNVMVHNETHAANVYAECISFAGLSTLADGSGDEDSAASAMSAVAALVVAMAGAFIF